MTTNFNPRYRIIINTAVDSWDGWFPSRLDDSPPVMSSDEPLPDEGDLPTLLTKVQELNRAALLSGEPLTGWAVIVYRDPQHDVTLYDRFVTPLTYCQASIRLPRDWSPKHLLDAPPNQQWESTLMDGDYSTGPFLEMLNETISHNRFLLDRWAADAKEDAAGRSTRHWHLLVASESCSEIGWDIYSSAGIVASQAVRRIHIVDPDKWHIPTGVDYSLAADKTDYFSNDELLKKFNPAEDEDEWIQILSFDKADGSSEPGPLCRRSELDMLLLQLAEDDPDSNHAGYRARVTTRVVSDQPEPIGVGVE